MPAEALAELPPSETATLSVEMEPPVAVRSLSWFAAYAAPASDRATLVETTAAPLPRAVIVRAGGPVVLARLPDWASAPLPDPCA